ncbi:MAG TPA: hypothetical protein VFH66_06380 [Mycobacteriales bacterium]|nr:hypothetical protein [Mycobacteriales bacterium]
MTLPPAHDHTHVVHNGKRDLSIDELAQMQPGMDRLMAEVGARTHRLYYAAQARNWRLAEYFYRGLVKQLRLCSTSRPKYAEEMAVYLEKDCIPVLNAIKASDLSAFDTAYSQLIDRANELHGVFGKGWIRWVTPASAPEEFDFTAGVEDA